MADGGDRGVLHDEEQRLRTLREYRILDTAAEPGFDRITRLVADLFEVPVALVSLVDDSRQWFKSAFGLDLPETHRDISFCRFIIAQGQPIVVPDATLDPRFRDNPLVTGAPAIRFYAGVPLRAYNGAILGGLSIADRKARPGLTAEELARLEDFAAIIMAEADLRRISIERDAARTMLERALDFSGVAAWQLDPRTDALRWQGAVAEIWGADYETALTTAEAAFGRIHPEDHALARAVLDESMANGTPYAVEYRILHPERGIRWLSIRGDWDVRSNDAMLTGVSIDITEQRNRRDNDTILMRELHHRMRNLFATVGAIISLTRHAATGVDDYVDRISSQLDALNRAQNVLLGANFLTGSMHALLREVEAAFPRVTWSGPDLELPENAVVAMALLFNELATNAVKHGALLSEQGRVDVHWSQDAEEVPDRQFRLTWTESGGAPIAGPPARTSFGTLLMERSVRNNLGGTIERHWQPGGLVCTISLPARWRDA
ncbi:GAF domain-containing protein [Sphingopyxis sp. PET50]|uniref:GAF domain-containing protein n=1 Tax=Sphingopyxis sp. PET50 TaxID=2976533 RepID=UPI0021AF81CA|nr:GAF domain-containing protein [Sphingopyxis sp. PET50]